MLGASRGSAATSPVLSGTGTGTAHSAASAVLTTKKGGIGILVLLLHVNSCKLLVSRRRQSSCSAVVRVHLLELEKKKRSSLHNTTQIRMQL